ncbi:MAG TPA: hypothetical protein VNV38_19425 [Stellaceae bacterium]|jgi:hypothetical protein|nr:hypothetical protein [Stellaceae bacterium]
MNILLEGAVAMLFAALVLAWIATFAKLVPLRAVETKVKDYGALISAHIDFLLMALLCMALYGLRIPLALVDCWMIVIGGLTNPGLFLMRAFHLGTTPSWYRTVYRLLSFGTVTIGFGWAGCSVLRAAL